MTSLSWMPNPTRQTRAHATTGKANTSVWGGIRVGLVALALLTLLRRRPSEAARRLKLDGPSRAPGSIRDGTDHGTRRDNQASALLPLVLAAGSRQGGQSHWRWRCFRMRSSCGYVQFNTRRCHPRCWHLLHALCPKWFPFPTNQSTNKFQSSPCSWSCLDDSQVRVRGPHSMRGPQTTGSPDRREHGNLAPLQPWEQRPPPSPSQPSRAQQPGTHRGLACLQAVIVARRCFLSNSGFLVRAQRRLLCFPHPKGDHSRPKTWPLACQSTFDRCICPRGLHDPLRRRIRLTSRPGGRYSPSPGPCCVFPSLLLHQVDGILS